ncbi:MAG: sulfite exporter TauE/SafE family protein [Bacteriovoracaceae bacterium]|nr:sulfite exporter TauE/SafE family protein [Bacteriovoracaceae bacterium]
MSLTESSGLFILWAAFVIGLAGSLHCIGMCGGLVMSCSQNGKSIWLYHVGRLLGYIFFGGLAGFLGESILKKISPQLQFIATISMGLFFIFLGLRVAIKKTYHFNFLDRISSSMGKLWERFVLPKPKMKSSFFIGALSVLLPCGLLYSVIFSLITFQNKGLGLVAMFMFWVGTLPAMVFAPHLMRKVLTPLQQKNSLILSFFLLSLGLLTLYIRLKTGISHACH